MSQPIVDTVLDEKDLKTWIQNITQDLYRTQIQLARKHRGMAQKLERMHVAPTDLMTETDISTYIDELCRKQYREVRSSEIGFRVSDKHLRMMAQQMGMELKHLLITDMEQLGNDDENEG